MLAALPWPTEAFRSRMRRTLPRAVTASASALRSQPQAGACTHWWPKTKTTWTAGNGPLRCVDQRARARDTLDGVNLVEYPRAVRAVGTVRARAQYVIQQASADAANSRPRDKEAGANAAAKPRLPGAVRAAGPCATGLVWVRCWLSSHGTALATRGKAASGWGGADGLHGVTHCAAARQRGRGRNAAEPQCVGGGACANAQPVHGLAHEGLPRAPCAPDGHHQLEEAVVCPKCACGRPSAPRASGRPGCAAQLTRASRARTTWLGADGWLCCRTQTTAHTLYYFKQPTDDQARDVEELEGCHMQPFVDNSEGTRRHGPAGARVARTSDDACRWMRPTPICPRLLRTTQP